MRMDLHHTMHTLCVPLKKDPLNSIVVLGPLHKGHLVLPPYCTLELGTCLNKGHSLWLRSIPHTLCCSVFFFSRANGDLARFLKAHNGDNFVKTHGADINKLVHRITSLFIR